MYTIFFCESRVVENFNSSIFVIFVETRMAFLQKNTEFVENRKPGTRKDVPYHLTFWDK